ncbi:MAG: hypothetical protein ACI3ZZ_02010 [Candidatus Aphodosoma sp.]
MIKLNGQNEACFCYAMATADEQARGVEKLARTIPREAEEEFIYRYKYMYKK